MKVSALFVAAALAAAGLAGARTRADFDVSPAVGPGNKIVTHAFADATETLVSNVRVFPYAFGDAPGQPYFLSDPGFHPQPDTSGFAPGSSIGIALSAPLRAWSGAGSPSFTNVTSNATIRFDFGASSIVSSGGSVQPNSGFSFAVVDANGEADDHLETYLLASGGTISNPGTPPAGVYLVTASVTSTTNGVSASDPIFLLFANGVSDDALDAATRYVRDMFAPGSNLAVVPEPASVATLALVALTARRRR